MALVGCILFFVGNNRNVIMCELSVRFHNANLESQTLSEKKKGSVVYYKIAIGTLRKGVEQ